MPNAREAGVGCGRREAGLGVGGTWPSVSGSGTAGGGGGGGGCGMSESIGSEQVKRKERVWWCVKVQFMRDDEMRQSGPTGARIWE